MRESYLIRKYRRYLTSKKLSTSTVDNYLVDASAFLRWFSSYLTRQSFKINPREPATYIAYVNKKGVSDFARQLALKNAAGATIKRKIAGLRKFLDFAVAQGYLIKNPVENIETPKSISSKEILPEFRKWIEKKGATDVTVKNYICDIRHFISWFKELNSNMVT
jgi:site-specific recombinase XerD